MIYSTLENIVAGLNKVGFSRKDFRIGNAEEILEMPTLEEPYHQMSLQTEEQKQDETNTFEDIVPEEIREVLGTGSKNAEAALAIADMIQKASKQAEEYNDAIADTNDSELIGGELGDMLQQNKI